MGAVWSRLFVVSGGAVVAGAFLTSGPLPTMIFWQMVDYGESGLRPDPLRRSMV